MYPLHLPPAANTNRNTNRPTGTQSADKKSERNADPDASSFVKASKFPPRLIVLGLSFLRDMVMTIDVEQGMVSLERPPSAGG